MVSPYRLLQLLIAVNLQLAVFATNQTRYNPALPGWHSDPSCVSVPDMDNQIFCTASTFMRTPGLPIYATRDLVNWRLLSHALNREEQCPDFKDSLPQTDGIWAATIRYHKGTFYIATVYKNGITGKSTGLIFSTDDIYDDAAWTQPIRYDAEYIDPDLFWDVDDEAYITSAGVVIQHVDLQTGDLTEPVNIWNGSTGVFLEGPHLYRKDGYYYLLVAEGGSGVNHSVTIARSKTLTGPYQGYENNPILTNRDTNQYMQNIGHGDLFKDSHGQWWAAALAWRSGVEAETYPMGREMVITPVTWEEGGWPIIDPVRGIQAAWSLPCSTDIPGNGGLTHEPDTVDFESGSQLPMHFSWWRWPVLDRYRISPPGHEGTLELTPSTFSVHAGATNLTAGFELDPLTLIMRLQTDTLFRFSVDVEFSPARVSEEVGVTAFLNQVQNINLGVVNMVGANSSMLSPHLRLITSGLGSLVPTLAPAPVVKPVPASWFGSPIRLFISAENSTHYAFSAASSKTPWQIESMGYAPASLLSGGMGDFTGEPLYLLFVGVARAQ